MGEYIFVVAVHPDMHTSDRLTNFLANSNNQTLFFLANNKIQTPNLTTPFRCHTLTLTAVLQWLWSKFDHSNKRNDNHATIFNSLVEAFSR